MKKLKNIVILLICLQLITPSVVEGCFRFPVLVSHFFHHNHNQEHEKINILSFVTEHYSEKHHDETHEEHENLPFHTHLDTSFNQILALNFDIFEFKLQSNFNFKAQKKIEFKQTHFQSNVSIHIWKPPKIS